MEIADRLRWGLIPLAVLIGLTAYVAADDVLVSFAFSAALGLAALAAAWLLLRGRRGGSVLAAGSAAALIAVQFVDLNTIGLGWMRLSYVAIGALTLGFAAAEVIASQWAVLRRTARARITP
ncbi:MAG: hypothetical protein LBV60_26335 [Streptomyces sp.]|nr:hypothetical protein [Streptomyces sp.]